MASRHRPWARLRPAPATALQSLRAPGLPHAGRWQEHATPAAPSNRLHHPKSPPQTCTTCRQHPPSGTVPAPSSSSSSSTPGHSHSRAGGDPVPRPPPAPAAPIPAGTSVSPYLAPDLGLRTGDLRVWALQGTLGGPGHTGSDCPHADLHHEL